MGKKILRLLAGSAIIILATNGCSSPFLRGKDGRIVLTEVVVRNLLEKIEIATQEKNAPEIPRHLSHNFTMRTHGECGEETLRTRVDYEDYIKSIFLEASHSEQQTTIESIELDSDGQRALVRVTTAELVVWDDDRQAYSARGTIHVGLIEGVPLVTYVEMQCYRIEEPGPDK